MAYRTSAQNFSKGEISPELWARTDVAYYNAALRRARNVIVLKYGGVTKRPGTRFVAEVFDPSNDVRLIPFQFSITQTYAIEMGQGYARFLALGGVVLNEALAVTSISNASNAVVAAAYHGYSVGDQVYFADIAGMVEINGRTATVVSVPDTGHFTIDLDTTGYGAFTGSTGGITRSGPPTPPPADPVVPPVVLPPDPPVVGGGGGGGGSRDPYEQIP